MWSALFLIMKITAAHSNYCGCQCDCTMAGTHFRCVSGSLRSRQSATAVVRVREARQVSALPGGLRTVPSRRREAGAGEAQQSSGGWQKKDRRTVLSPSTSTFSHSTIRIHSVSQPVSDFSLQLLCASSLVPAFKPSKPGLLLGLLFCTRHRASQAARLSLVTL